MKVLVIGGTGTVGREVVRALGASGIEPRILTRSAGTADSLPVESAVGDLARPETLAPAFDGVDGAFVLVPLGPDETERALAAVEAARTARLARLVYMSVAMPPGSEVIPHFASKLPVERAIRASGIPWTILRPNNFFQNDVALGDAIFRHGVYPQPIGSRGLNRVDVRDIAEAAAHAFARPGHDGVFALNGPRGLTGDDTARIYTERLGRPVRYLGDDLDEWGRQAAAAMPEWLIRDLQVMFRYFQDYGLHASGTDFAAQERILGHAPRPFETFAEELVSAWKAGQ